MIFWKFGDVRFDESNWDLRTFFLSMTVVKSELDPRLKFNWDLILLGAGDLSARGKWRRHVGILDNN